MRRPSRFALVALIVMGCGSGGQSVAPTVPGPSPTASAGASSSSVGGTPSPEVSPSQPASGGLALESVAEVVTDDLRVRSAPGVDETRSIMLEPLLQPGAKVYVVDGPVGAAGYEWYELLTFDVNLTPQGDNVDEQNFEDGWVAAADKNGEPWIQPFAPECPPTPTVVNDIVATDEVTALACFSGVPITLAGRILDCQTSPELDTDLYCGADTGGESFQPDWFDRGFGYVVPEEGSFDQDSMLVLHVDPLGTYPDPLPYGAPVNITGQFNHPAASACTVYHYFKNDTPSVHCRAQFAVTAIEAR